MAIKPVDNESFYREVDEELRRERVTGFWRRYRFAVIGGIVLLLAAIAGGLYWYNRQQEIAGERGEQLSQIFEDIQAGKVDQASPKLDVLAKEGNDGFRAAALLTKADIALQTGDEATALTAFKAVAEDDGLAKPYRDLALVRQTAIEFDKLEPAAIVTRLGPLAKPGNSWFGSAGEMVAIAHLKQGKPELAAPIFAAMAKDEKLPASIRARAVGMAGALGVDAIPPSLATGDPAASKEITE